MNTQNQSIITEIINIKDSLPKKQRQLCDYILENYQSIGLITIKELAHNAKVGISTITRTLSALGYDHFNDLRKDLYNESVPTNSKWTLKKSFSEIPNEGEDVPTLVQVSKEAINLLGKSLDSNLIENLETAVDLISRASHVNVLGSRPYKAMALYFEQLLGEFYSKTRQLSHDTEVLCDKILQFDEDEVLLVFAFEPYTNRIIEAAMLAHELGIKIILITDHIFCPIIQYASVTLQVEVSKETFSVAPIIVLIEALVIELGKRSSEESIKKLKKLERTLIEKNVTFAY
ncbi:MurR/RpiR family transcriptional regulator [Priestia megaterium]|uniref:MurR/RpiR family transcriptional regulator n=1 Tax=Priestia megaterium TaxID=1404 RepID=UPI0021AC4D4B|nr:MurR/RpiR family transcriptional regulator [Priestia megaterium]MCR8928882.1 MurR/RpiR family transcriptional regulator [Priestia megaterium]